MPAEMTDDDLMDQALLEGVTVELSDGSLFNTDRVKRKPQKKYTPPPVVAEPKQQDLRPLIEGMIRAVQNIEFPAPSVQVAAPAGAQPKVEVKMPDPIRQWVFTVERNKDGFIKTITARAE